MTKRKRTIRTTMIYKTIHKKLKIEKHEPRSYGKVVSFCSTSGTRRVTVDETNIISYQSVLRYSKKYLLSWLSARSHIEVQLNFAVSKSNGATILLRIGRIIELSRLILYTNLHK
jgi:hypothetical protein